MSMNSLNWVPVLAQVQDAPVKIPCRSNVRWTATTTTISKLPFQVLDHCVAVDDALELAAYGFLLG